MTTNETRKLKVRLTSSQLYDLYARLDINGDGELDMSEFMAVCKQLDFDDENLVVRDFQFADPSASGQLDAEDFMSSSVSVFTVAI